jgi:hypothetical protein
MNCTQIFFFISFLAKLQAILFYLSALTKTNNSIPHPRISFLPKLIWRSPPNKKTNCHALNAIETTPHKF